jgi:hypothetical protein
VREPVAPRGPVQIARDREEPRSNPCVRSQSVRVPHQPEPRFVQQILGERPIPAHPQQEPENPRTIGVVHGVERVGVAGSEPCQEALVVQILCR